MNPIMPASVFWPLLAALLMWLGGTRMAARSLLRASLAASLLTLLLALWAAVLPVPPSATGGLWSGDRLAVSLAVLAAIPAVLAAPVSVPASAVAVRELPVLTQLMTAGAIAACRGGTPFVVLMGLAVVFVASALPDRHPGRKLLPVAALLLTAWLGAALLAAGDGAAPLQSGLGRPTIAPATHLCGLLLLLLPMLLLTWIGPSGILPDPPGGDIQLYSLALLLPGLPALGIVLRLCGLHAADPLPRPDASVIVGVGLLALLLSVAMLPGRKTLPERVPLAVAAQLSTVMIGFGIGGTGGVAGGLMILGALVFLLPLIKPHSTGAGSCVAWLIVPVLAGLPPFGLFSGDFMLLLRLFGTAPLLGLAVLAGLAAASLGLLATWRPEPAAWSRFRWQSILPALLVLALLGWLGLAMPGGLSDWLLGLSEPAASPPPALAAPS